MWQIFRELLLIKESQTTLQNKETTVQSCRKILNENTKKSSGIEGSLFNCTGEMEMDNFACMNGSLYLFCLFFCNKPAKKILACVSLHLNLPPPPPPHLMRVRTLLAGPHLQLSERTYFTDDHQVPAPIVRDYIPMPKTWMLITSYLDAYYFYKQLRKQFISLHRFSRSQSKRKDT